MNEPDEPTPLFLAVGHCGPDSWMLRTAVQRVVPDAAVEPVDRESDLDARLDAARERPVVLLVNRKLDGDFTAEDGIDLIAGRREGTHVALLVTNLADAMAEAEAVGALPGFGKSGLHDEGTSNVLRRASDAASARIAS